MNFLGLTDEEARFEACRGVVVPVPYERTVSWGAGTERGPAAIIEASQYVELYDEVLRRVTVEHGGIHTAAAVDPGDDSPEVYLERLRAVADRVFADDRFPIFLGGEHALTSSLVRAAAGRFDDLSVLQFDAHTDLRNTYHGSPWNHACVMRRVHEMGVPAVPVGIRAVSPAEAEFIEDHRLPVFWSHEIADGDAWMEAAIDRLTKRVFITFDVDFFDPSVVPSTGTPEPGGGFWHPTMRFLERVFEARDVVGMDVVELAPIAGLHAPDFVVARLVYRAFGLAFR